MSMSCEMSCEMSNSNSNVVIKKLTKKVVREMIEECGRLYNFDSKEALIKLNLEKEKVKKEKVKKSTILLPFDGTKKEGCCNGIVKNHGLYTQCTKKVDGFCKSCESQPYGNIDQRLNAGLYEYKDPKGKSPKNYLEVLKKKNIGKEEIMSLLSRDNLVVAEAHLVECPEKSKRGRPKKEKEAKEPSGKKGRPKKEKKVVEVTNQEDDLFASLVAQAQVQVSVPIESPVSVEVEAPVVKEVAKPKKEKVAKETTGKKGRPKKENKTVEVNNDVVAVPAPVISKVVEEETPDVVKKFEFEGKSYYKSKKSGIIYNMDQEVVGKWNEDNNKIDFEEEEYEETEDDYDE